MLGAPGEILASLAAKSVTAPIAMALTESIGGIPALAAVLVVLTGILGSVIVTPLMNALRHPRLRRPRLRGRGREPRHRHGAGLPGQRGGGHLRRHRHGAQRRPDRAGLRGARPGSLKLGRVRGCTRRLPDQPEEDHGQDQDRPVQVQAGGGGAAAPHPHRPRRGGDARHLRRPRRAARRHLRALPQDQELPLAHVGPALPRLPPAPRRAGRPDLRDDRPDGRARPQARRPDPALDRRDRPPPAHRGQRRRLRRARRT